ncbi:MAG: aromatic ring-hydroxylating oxygenase subunit alpha [Planctomycetia bacterium]
MFVSDTHLPQLLPPEAYHDRGWYDREVERVLRPAWWAVAAADDLPHEGDFVTFDHVDGPVILRRCGGEIRGYRNVCAHRMAKLTGRARGRCAALRCEYHGWEYDDSGATRRIPDAPSFRPLEKGRLGLDVLRVETVGAIVFLSSDHDAPPVREWLGVEADRIEDRFGPRTRTIWRADIDVPVNWKLLVENNLESYHVGTVHAATLGPFPEEGVCSHELTAGRSRFMAPSKGSAWLRCRQAIVDRLAGRQDDRYTHSIVHPGFLWIYLDVLSGFQTVLPTGPRSCRLMIRCGALQAATSDMPWADWAARACVAFESRFWKRVIDEDLAILPQVQAGVDSPRHPGPGLISRREERIVHFQRWLLDRMRLDGPYPFAHSLTTSPCHSQGASA